MGVTNAHVVAGLAAITGRFNSGEKVALHVLAWDPCTDLAVVHFSSALPDSTQSLIIGNSGQVSPGDSVTVLGYPLTLTHDASEQKLLITSGLVSATKVVAQPPGLPEFNDTIQHAATINHGNSGGPLLDDHGRVVGINTLVNPGSADQPAQGQFYSIAIDSAKRELVDKLLKGESQNDMGWVVEEYYPGFFADLDSKKGLARDLELYHKGIESGLYVKAVTPGAGASNAGIEVGMLLTKLQNTSISSVAETCAIVESILPGSIVEVEGLVALADAPRFTTQFHSQFVIPGKH
ncbi:S1C family serine protease [Pseudarthrobacter sp. P1]|uniref:S1C family serine protease n=1 Tax=Pseudarthrobacter sp. P1 TaxID=3418418 RepID=UPI003CF5D9A8